MNEKFWEIYNLEIIRNLGPEARNFENLGPDQNQEKLESREPTRIGGLWIPDGG